jgi:pilus assembly protein CpaB
MQSRVLAILVAVVLALVATAALVVYVNGADRRAISDQEPRQVWVAIKAIPAGTSGETARNTELIGLREVPRRNVVAGGVISLSQIQGKHAAVDIVAGEQLLQKRWVGAEEVTGRRLLTIPPKHQALSIGVDTTRQVAGFVTPGDKVSLVLSISGQGGESLELSRFLLQNIQVLAVGATALANATTQGGGGRVDQSSGGGGGDQSRSANLTAVTLAVPEKHVERVVYAAENGSIYLTLMPPDAEPAPPSDGVTGGNVFGGQ